MKGKTSSFWFVLWLICFLVLAVFLLYSIVRSEQQIIFLQNGFPLDVAQYTDRQIVPVLLINLFCLIPLLCASCYSALKEKKYALKNLTLFLIFLHVIGEISILVQFLN